MYVGFTSSTTFMSRGARNSTGAMNSSVYTETHRISAWNFNSSGLLDPAPLPSPPAGISQPPEPRQQKSSQVGVIAGVCAAVFGALLMGLCLFWFLKHRNKKLNPFDKPAHQSTSRLTLDTSNSRPYTFKELSSITRDFSDSKLLSSGAFGDVYKGSPPSGGPVAVKRIKHNKEHGQASFVAEAASLRQIRHRNLLLLRGWCEAKQGLFLACDYMSNGSLDKWLHPSPNSKQVNVFEACLSWNVRRSILAGVASALERTHEDCVQCIMHRDIKASNVMLDSDFNSYLGDFGPPCLVDHRKVQKTTMLAGTLGYMAPEMHYTGRATKQTDVYAFGVLVLEVVCGTTPIILPDSQVSQVGGQPGDFLLLERVWRAHEAGDISKMKDSRLLVQSNRYAPGELEMVAKFLQLGLLCCLPNPSERPSMRLVNQWFQASEGGSAMEFPSLPATKPALLGQANASMPQSSEGTSSSQSSDATRLSAR